MWVTFNSNVLFWWSGYVVQTLIEEQSRYEYTLRDYNSTLLPLTYNSNPTKSKVVYAAFSLFYDFIDTSNKH